MGALGSKVYQATEEDRIRVEAWVVAGVARETIAAFLGIGVGTLTRCYRRELDTAGQRANAQVARRLYDLTRGVAPNGSKVSPRDTLIACLFWLKTRARWRETDEPPLPVFDYGRLPPEKRRLLRALLEEAQVPEYDRRMRRETEAPERAPAPVTEPGEDAPTVETTARHEPREEGPAGGAASSHGGGGEGIVGTTAGPGARATTGAAARTEDAEKLSLAELRGLMREVLEPGALRPEDEADAEGNDAPEDAEGTTS